MRCSPRLARWLALALVTSLSVQAVSCGTILYPERRGQPAGRLDPTVVVLDAVGLLLFFVPGVIAFAVDFSNGTIYLPPEGYGQSLPDDVGSPELAAIRLDRGELDQRHIEEIVSAHAGQPVSLEPGGVRVRELNAIGEFPAQYASLAAAGSDAPPTRLVFHPAGGNQGGRAD